MGFGMWLPHADGKSVIGLFYDSFVANELRSKWKMENGKWKMENGDCTAPVAPIKWRIEN
jgi:hypothetical protein